MLTIVLQIPGADLSGLWRGCSEKSLGSGGICLPPVGVQGQSPIRGFRSAKQPWIPYGVGGVLVFWTVDCNLLQFITIICIFCCCNFYIFQDTLGNFLIDFKHVFQKCDLSLIKASCVVWQPYFVCLFVCVFFYNNLGFLHLKPQTQIWTSLPLITRKMQG